MAKKVFVPRTANDLAADKVDLLAAAKRLDEYLATQGVNGQAWKKFVMFEEMQKELGKPSPDLRALDAIHQRYVHGHENLQLTWFGAVRQALRQYLVTARAMANPAFKTRYPQLLDDLAARLTAYRKNPTAQEAAAINADLEALHQAGQPLRLIHAVQANFSRPNTYIHASAWLVGVGIVGPISQTAPVSDNILGTNVYGTATTTGQITTELVPSSELGIVDALIQATVSANNVGYARSVQVFSTSTTQVSGRKRIEMDPQKAWGLPAASQAATNSSINGIAARSRIGERRAWGSALGQQAEAEQEGARHAEQRVNQQIDRRGEENLAQMNARYVEKLRDPLLQRSLFPRVTLMSTTPAAVHVTVTQSQITELGAPSLPPAPTETWDLASQIHESAVHNTGNIGYAGVIVEQESFLASLKNLLGKVPERFQDEDKSEPWTITLADRDPFAATFQNDLITVHLRGKAYAKGNNQYPSMNVTAVYKPQRTPQGVKLIRQGPVEIYPPGFEPGKGETLSGREQVLRSLLTKRFNKIFDAEMVPKPLEFQGNWKKAGQLGLVDVKAQGGWLVLAWRRIPGTQPPPESVLAQPAPPQAAPAQPPPAQPAAKR